MGYALKRPRVDGVYEEKAWDPDNEKWMPTGRLIRDDYDNKEGIIRKTFIGSGRVVYNGGDSFKIEWNNRPTAPPRRRRRMALA